MDIAELAHLRRARDLLDREYARPLNVPAMARAALMSPSLFARQFRAAYGETPYAYLQARRVERAMGLLRGGRMSVTDVCLAVGFTSLGYLRGAARGRHRDPLRASRPALRGP